MSSSTADGAVLWDAETLARIRSLQLTARQTVEGLLLGDHRSMRVGASVEFADYQAYQAGDDLRHLDWKVLGRSDRLVTRRYQLETEWPCMIVLDASGDLSTGGGQGPKQRRWLSRLLRGNSTPPRPALDGTKFGYSVQLAATLAWAMTRRNEPVGLCVLGGETQGARLLLPKQGRSQLARIVGTLADLRPAGQAGLAQGLASVGPRMRSRSLVALVSDFMEEPGDWGPSLLALAKRRCDLAAFHVLDRQEMELDFDQPALFFSPEGGDALQIDPQGAQREFAEVRDAWLMEVESRLRAHRARYYPCLLEQGVAAPLRSLFRGHPGQPLRLERDA